MRNIAHTLQCMSIPLMHSLQLLPYSAFSIHMHLSSPSSSIFPHTVLFRQISKSSYLVSFLLVSRFLHRPFSSILFLSHLISSLVLFTLLFLFLIFSFLSFLYLLFFFFPIFSLFISYLTTFPPSLIISVLCLSFLFLLTYGFTMHDQPIHTPFGA